MPRSPIYENPGLRQLLSVALPLWRERVSRYHETVCIRRAHAASEIIGCYGDVLLFRPKKSRKSSRLRSLIDIVIELGDSDSLSDTAHHPTSGEVFNTLAEGIAILERLYSDESWSGAKNILCELFGDTV